MKRRWKLLGAVCVFVVGVTFLRIPWEAEQKSRVERQFHADLEELTQTAELVLAGQEAEAPSGWRDVSRFDDVVCFDYGGWGFGSSTRYWGVNYVTDNRLVGFQGMSMEGAAPMEKVGSGKRIQEITAAMWNRWLRAGTILR